MRLRRSPLKLRPALAAVALIALLLLPSCGSEPLPGSPSEGCLLAGCHNAVEQIHYGGPDLTCVDCHGGDPDSAEKETAHVTVDVSFNPSTPGGGFLDKPSLQQLDALPPEVIRFLNPSDYRVAQATCGSSAAGGISCHPSITEASLMLNRATLAGQLAGGGFLAGAQPKGARYGIRDIVDQRSPEQIGDGFTRSLRKFPTEVPDDVVDPVARAFFPVYEQLCMECHLGKDGPHIPGLYYSAGCSGCHMPTEDDGRARTADATQDLEELGHVSSHRLTNLVPDSQCARCHISHLARALLVQGVRERSEPEGDASIGGPNRGVEDPEDVVAWSQDNYVRYQGGYQIYGKPYPYYLEDEDGTNDIDETPPDVHTAAGMGCIDCHNIREVHGDAQMAQTMDREIDVRCETCHGRPGELGSLRSDAGLPFNRALTTQGGTGSNEPVFDVRADGVVQQRVRFDSLSHFVTQITRNSDATDIPYNPRTRAGCELHAGTAARRAQLKAEVNALAASDPELVPERFPGIPVGFSFPPASRESDGRLECFACHNRWTVNCYGCHMVRDDRETYVSAIDGQVKPGRVDSLGLSVVADGLSLGFNSRGRISPLVGTAIFFTHIDAEGERVIDAVPMRDGDGVEGAGNVHNAVHHHTVQRQPRDCDGCHPSVSGSQDDDALKTALGLGSGRYTFVDGLGTTHLLDQLVEADYDGDGQPDDPAASPLPASVVSVRPVVSTTHRSILPDAADGPGPGPLDAATINRVLASPVTPQRPLVEER